MILQGGFKSHLCRTSTPRALEHGKHSRQRTSRCTAGPCHRWVQYGALADHGGAQGLRVLLQPVCVPSPWAYTVDLKPEVKADEGTAWVQFWASAQESRKARARGQCLRQTLQKMGTRPEHGSGNVTQPLSLIQKENNVGSFIGCTRKCRRILCWRYTSRSVWMLETRESVLNWSPRDADIDRIAISGICCEMECL